MVKVRQLPGIAFRAETLTNSITLPRMDIAAFVGFAQRGPCDTPVVIEDYPQFEEIFGGSYFLAWDAESDSAATACLASTVRIFFRQGGRRCWVVRIAGPEASANRYALLGALTTRLDSLNSPIASPLTAQACSVGAWADGLQVSLELLGETLAITRGIDTSGYQANNLKQLDETPIEVIPNQAITLLVAPVRGQSLQVGDLLQLDLSLVAANGDANENPPLTHRLYVAPEADEMQPNRQRTRILLPPERSHWFRKLDTAVETGDEEDLSEELKEDFDGTISFLHPTTQAATSWKAKQQLLQIELPSEAFPPRGSWLRLERGAAPNTSQYWLLVGETKKVNDPANNDPTKTKWGVQLLQAWQQGPGDVDGTLLLRRVQRVRLALHVRDREGVQQTVSDLACVPAHPRYIGNLVKDERFFANQSGDATAAPPRPALWAELVTPRFPIAMPDETSSPNPQPLIIPLGLGPIRLWSERLPDPTNALVRDGLIPSTALHSQAPSAWANFISSLYLDESLRHSGERALLAEATDLVYLTQQPLHGIHSLLPIEEISLIALPDAAHRGWELLDLVPTDESEPATSLPTDPCIRPGPFAPEPKVVKEADKSTLIATFDAQPPQPHKWRLLPASSYDSSGLLAIQRGAALLAAARGDLMAVLTLPRDFQSDAAIDHQQRLLADLQLVGDKTSSYVSLYHPWVVYRQEGAGLLHVEPSGVACGVIAARSQQRGAWIPPANELATAVVAVSPPAQPGDDRRYFNAGINTIARMPQGFTLWGAHTQSTSADLEDINVRRLLILLRRMAVREGDRYAFATNGPIFRRQLKQQFEQLLAHLYALGAFAGDSADEAFQVSVDEIGSPAAAAAGFESAREQGRLQVELRIAPSQPLTYILVRLIQSDGGLLAVHEGLPNGR